MTPQRIGGNNMEPNLLTDEDEFEDDQVQHPQQRNAANARERARMRVLSKAFCRLKTTLPWVPPDTKLSKLDTLRLATSYIAHLRAILKLSENEIPKPNVQPTNMSWPFNFHLNWDAQTAKNGNSTTRKAEWNCYTGKGYDKKRILDGNSAHEYQNKRKCSNNRNVKIRRKSYTDFCEIEKSLAQTNAELDYNYYKSCMYFE